MVYLSPYVGSGTSDDPFIPQAGVDAEAVGAAWSGVDMRDDPTVVAGNCLVNTDPSPLAVVSATVLDLGVSMDTGLSGQRRSALVQRLGTPPIPSGTTLRTVIRNILTVWAGDVGVNPLQPTDGTYTLTLGTYTDSWAAP